MTNNRIRELAKQSDCTIDGMGYGEGNIEQFAAALLDECLSVIAEAGQDGKLTQASCQSAIRTHFGLSA